MNPPVMGMWPILSQDVLVLINSKGHVLVALSSVGSWLPSMTIGSAWDNIGPILICNSLTSLLPGSLFGELSLYPYGYRKTLTDSSRVRHK